MSNIQQTQSSVTPEKVSSNLVDGILPQSDPNKSFHHHRTHADFETAVAKLDRPEIAFNPTDPWAVTFRRGLAQLHLPEGAVGIEVGVGMGTNIAFLLERHPTAIMFGTDIIPEITQLAERAIPTLIGAAAERFKPLHGSWDLLEGLPEQVDPLHLVFGCIPQVKFPPSEHLPQDAAAHYYRERHAYITDPHFQELYQRFDEWELGLNARLLHQSQHVLSEHGQIVLNLAGRVPLTILESMFVEYGYRPHLLQESMVLQDTGTSLERLAQDERTNSGKRYEFFTDPDGTQPPVNARVAFMLQEDAKPIYHKLYVIAGRRSRH